MARAQIREDRLALNCRHIRKVMARQLLKVSRKFAPPVCNSCFMNAEAVANFTTPPSRSQRGIFLLASADIAVGFALSEGRSG